MKYTCTTQLPDYLVKPTSAEITAQFYGVSSFKDQPLFLSILFSHQHWSAFLSLYDVKDPLSMIIPP